MIVTTLAMLLATGPADAQRGTLAQAAQAFDDAQFHHDRVALEHFLAPDMLFVTGSGTASDRAAFIAGCPHGRGCA